MFCVSRPKFGRLVAAATFVAIATMATSSSHAQFFRQGAVGGVKIDAEGVLTNPEVGDMKELQAAWQKGLQKVPADLNQWTALRFVSLRRLESQLADAAQARTRCGLVSIRWSPPGMVQALAMARASARST